MSMIVSYRKQVLFGIAFLLVLLAGIEVASQIYSYVSLTTCYYGESEAADSYDWMTRTWVCDDLRFLRYEYGSGHRQLVPDQLYHTITINEQ